MVIMSFWHFRTTSQLSLTTLGTFALFTFICLAYGNAFLRLTALLLKNQAGITFQFLIGFFLFNTFLFILSLTSPFGLSINVLMLSIGALILITSGVAQQANTSSVYIELPSLLCILISGVAATLWCTDSQPPMVIDGQAAIYQTWQDTFFHVREISAFAQAHGMGTIQDIRMSGAPAPVYHFASYQSASAISLLTGVSAVNVYSSFQLPFGILLTGLAAFSLIATIWGGWPALAATVAIVLFPDAYQQGFANRYLSYNFLSQVNLGMLYGIACAAIAWIYVIEGGLQRKIGAILIGYIFLGICLFYKAHIFVANAFLVMIYPWLFFDGLKLRWRLSIVCVLTGIFFLVIIISQTIERVPVIRIDGSGIGAYVVGLLRNFDPGYLKSFYTDVFMQRHYSKPIELLYIIALLLLSTFGLWLAVTSVVAFLGKKQTTVANISFPILIVANYLVMSIGLALDTRGVGTPDELLNRPAVWAYFAIVAWSTGFFYYILFGNSLPKYWLWRSLLFIMLSLAMGGVYYFSKNIQTFPARSGFVKYSDFNAVPICLVRATEYIRDNSRTDELVQDSENDPRFIVTALTERQRFAGKSIFGKPDKELQERLDGLVEFKNMSNPLEITSYAALHQISWYLLQPATSVLWPMSVRQNSVFQCDGFKVFHFGR